MVIGNWRLNEKVADHNSGNWRFQIPLSWLSVIRANEKVVDHNSGN